MILKKNKMIVPNKDITYFLNPDYVYIPASKIYVKQNDYVYKRQIVADKAYSTVSGYVIGKRKNIVMGKVKNTVVIENDYREYFKDKEIKMKVTIPNILKLLENDKVLFDKFKSNKKFSNIIVSAINDNPYVYNEIYLLKENISDILDFYNKLITIYNSSNNMLVVKNNEAFIIDECLNVIGSYPEINLTLVKDEYNLEHELFLKKCLRVKENTLVLRVSDIIKMYNLFKGNVLCTHLITISGDVIKDSKVIRVKVGTLLKDVIDKFIMIECNNYVCVINGLMTGFKINNIDEFVITDDVISINIMKDRCVKKQECIRCGKCIEVCPLKVNPVSLENKEKCIKCGLCSYVCPCNINLKEVLNK